MDQAQRDKLSELVEELTTSGEPQLNQDQMKEVKKICKVSNNHIEHFYHLIMTQLGQEHAEIRLSAFQMACELFARSHHFRVLLVDNFQDFLDLTVETDSDQPLPPPKEVARKLKTLAIRTVQEWQAAYGEAYKKLALGYHFLQQVKKVDFQDVQARTLAERKRQEEKKKRLERIYKEKVTKATAEMEEASQEIKECLVETDTCMKLLLPTCADFDLHDLEPAAPADPAAAVHPGKADGEERPCCSKDVQEEENREQETSSEGGSDFEEVPGEGAFIRDTGLLSYRYSLDLNLLPVAAVRESEDNDALVTILRDRHRLITTKYLPAALSWVQLFTKAGVEEPLLRRALDTKQSLESAVRKFSELKIDYRSGPGRGMKGSDNQEEEEEEDDFEEVPEKEGFEPRVPEHLRAEYGLEPTASTSTAPVAAKRPAPARVPQAPPRRAWEEEDPTCAAATLRLLRERLPPPSTAGTSAEPLARPGGSVGEPTEELRKAPIVPFGLDLYYWGEDQPTAGKIIKNVSQHQFWVPHEVEEEVENTELSAQMKSRCIPFAGRFQPVTHVCRAPMPDGSLCARRDRLKCPFHGPVVPRDELGTPTDPEDRARLQREEWKRREEQPDWRDPELMREIEAATGEDLGSSRTFGKGKRGKGKRKYPKLSDLKQSANTSRARLERKVFNKSSMRRVTAVMNKIDKRKHEKFANQFNYALN